MRSWLREDQRWQKAEKGLIERRQAGPSTETGPGGEEAASRSRFQWTPSCKGTQWQEVKIRWEGDEGWSGPSFLTASVPQSWILCLSRAAWSSGTPDSLRTCSFCRVLLPTFPGGSDGKSICLQCRRPGFNPWVGKIPWRRKWQPTPVLSPGNFHGWRSLVGYSPWGRKESDTSEQLHLHCYQPGLHVHFQVPPVCIRSFCPPVHPPSSLDSSLEVCSSRSPMWRFRELFSFAFVAPSSSGSLGSSSFSQQRKRDGDGTAREVSSGPGCFHQYSISWI